MIRFDSGVPSNMPPQHSFSQVPRAEIQRSVFDRSHKHLTTFDAGFLIPVYVDEVLPGDTFHMNMQAFCRLATPLKPVMDNMFLDSFFFFVPYRLLWDNFEKQMGDQDDPLNPVAYVEPVCQFQSGTTGPEAKSIFDYFGIPPVAPTGGLNLEISAYPLLAYNLIWNEWFRDQNMQSPVTPVGVTGTAPVTVIGSSFSGLLRRGKRHDYFTSCLPWPQKGPSVTVSLASQAPLHFDNFEVTQVIGLADYGKIRMVNTGGELQATSPPGGAGQEDVELHWPAAEGATVPGAYADLTSATATSINALREAFQLQRMLERDARGGTRFTEIIRNHFGVVAPDARLQRPEYLGGGSVPVNVHPVAQTAPEGGTPTTFQGNLAAFGTSGARGGFSQSFTEHGVVIGMVSARADLTYQQGVNRMWFRRTRYDRYWPALAHLGEQAVLNQEIFWDDNGGQNAGIFGYQERWAEYRYKPSLISGEFRSSFAQTLDIWHLAQSFSVVPVLGDTFISEDPPVDRVIAVQDEPHFIGEFWFGLRCVRPMPVFSVPGLIDHF